MRYSSTYSSSVSLTVYKVSLISTNITSTIRSLVPVTYTFAVSILALTAMLTSCPIFVRLADVSSMRMLVQKKETDEKTINATAIVRHNTLRVSIVPARRYLSLTQLQ